nr:MAG TPA: hypothetical protein [Bacteriophage sp.]
MFLAEFLPLRGKEQLGQRAEIRNLVKPFASSERRCRFNDSVEHISVISFIIVCLQPSGGVYSSSWGRSNRRHRNFSTGRCSDFHLPIYPCNLFSAHPPSSAVHSPKRHPREYTPTSNDSGLRARLFVPRCCVPRIGYPLRCCSLGNHHPQRSCPANSIHEIHVIRLKYDDGQHIGKGCRVHCGRPEDKLGTFFYLFVELLLRPECGDRDDFGNLSWFFGTYRPHAFDRIFDLPVIEYHIEIEQPATDHGQPAELQRIKTKGHGLAVTPFYLERFVFFRKCVEGTLLGKRFKVLFHDEIIFVPARGLDPRWKSSAFRRDEEDSEPFAFEGQRFSIFRGLNRPPSDTTFGWSQNIG